MNACLEGRHDARPAKENTEAQMYVIVCIVADIVRTQGIRGGSGVRGEGAEAFGNRGDEGLEAERRSVPVVREKRWVGSEVMPCTNVDEIAAYTVAVGGGLLVGEKWGEEQIQRGQQPCQG
jgi:hypothetical protein